jgi:hypothetical protein
VLEPVAYGCREHGGGRQHGEYSAQRQRLAELGWSIGTVFAALTFAELGDDATRRQRLRELALERYLTDVDDGWVLRRARNYRGRVQIEGEEATGRELLLGLLADREWLANNFLLARESVRVIPHPGQADDIARDVRREAIELADSDSRFEPLRAEIHGAPSASTARRVRAWADGRSGRTRGDSGGHVHRARQAGHVHLPVHVPRPLQRRNERRADRQVASARRTHATRPGPDPARRRNVATIGATWIRGETHGALESSMD